VAAIPFDRDRSIYSVIVVAQLEGLGDCLEGVLRGQGYQTRITQSYDRFPGGCDGKARVSVDPVIVTNAAVPPDRILSIIPDIKARHPHARIIVLSGNCPGVFVADLTQKGIDGFLPLPFEEDALLPQVATLLSGPPL
jgi:DNA-binding NtrC family response regulator